MSRYAIVTDTHLGLNSNNEKYQYLVESLFYNIYDYCIKNNINKILHLGDFFHYRKQTSNKTLSHALDIAEELPNNINMYIVIGNHDTYYSSSLFPSTLEVFSEYKNIHLVSEPIDLDDIIMVPWGYKDLKSLPKDKVLCGHFDINGFPMVKDVVSYDASFSKSDFVNFQQVFSGHYHKPSQQGNIQYLGAPFQHNFGDVGEDRGWYTYIDGKLEKQKFEAPEYKLIFYSLKEGEISKENIKGHNIKLIFDVEISTKEMTDVVDIISALEPMSFGVERRVKDYSTALNETEKDLHLKSNSDIINEYINNVEAPAHIKKPLAKNIIQSLLKETMDKDE